MSPLAPVFGAPGVTFVVPLPPTGVNPGEVVGVGVNAPCVPPLTGVAVGVIVGVIVGVRVWADTALAPIPRPATRANTVNVISAFLYMI